MEAADQIPAVPPEGDDPFAGVEPDPDLAGDPLPPGVEQGELGGTDATEPLPEGEAPVEEEPPVEPEPGEPLPPAEPDPEPEPPEPEPGPEAEVAAPPEPPPVEEPPPPPEPEPEPAPPEPPPPDEPPDAPPATEDEPEAKKPPAKKKAAKKKAKKKAAKGGKHDREYVILTLGKPQDGRPTWPEAFDRENPEEPHSLLARNGEVALRRAYRALDEDDEGAEYVLVAVPKAYFRPQPVAGKVQKQTAIKIG